MITQFIKNKLAFNIKNYLALAGSLFLVISINSNSSHLKIFNDFEYKFDLNSLIVIFNTFRFLIPFFIFFILVLITLISLKYFINQKHLVFLIILKFNFIFQLIVYKFHFLQFDIGYIQLAINCINFALIFSLSNAYKLKLFNKIIFYFTFIFLFLVSIYFSINILISAINTGKFYLYWTERLSPIGQFIGQPNPRVTGLSKILVMYFVFHFFVFFQTNKNKNIINYLVLFICIFFIYGMQTRGGLAGIIIFTLFYIFFVEEIFLNKLKKLILILLIPILFYEIFMNSIFEMNFYKKIKIEKDLKLEKTNRYVKDDSFLIHSSGRSDLWKIGINEIKKNEIIFGYGPQGDRQIFDKLKNDNSLENSRAIKWSTNISNGLLYTYLSGGIFSLLTIISIYILTIKEIIFAIFFNGVFKKNCKTEIVSIFCLIYLCFRSLYENSFAVFSTDYILLVINFFNLYKFNLNSKIKSFKK